ncbi:MAG: TolC family protein [Saprospiraceae bacterium]
MNINFRSILFLSILCGTFFVRAQQSFTLEEAIRYALQNSNQVKLNQLNLIDAEAQLMEYKSIGYPKINAAIDYSHYFAIPATIIPDFLSPVVDGRLVYYKLLDSNKVEGPSEGGFPAKFGQSNSLSGSVGVNTILYDPSFFVGLKATKLYKELVKRQNSVSDITIRQSVAKAYLGSLISIKSKELLDQNIKTLDKMTRETQMIQAKGFVEQIDVDRLSLSLNTLQTEAEKISRMTDITYNVLKMQMGYPMDQPIELTDKIDALVNTLKVDNADLVAPYKLEQRPEYRTMQLADELNKIRMQSIKLGAYPAINGFINAAYGTQTNNIFNKNSFWFPTAVAGFKVNVPIFDGFSRKAKYQRASIETDKLHLQMNDFERAMSLEVSSARIAFENAKSSLESTKRNLELAQRIYDQAQAKFKGGIGSSIEINQAETAFLQQQGAYVNALYALLIAKTDLDKALGK